MYLYLATLHSKLYAVPISKILSIISTSNVRFLDRARVSTAFEIEGRELVSFRATAAYQATSLNILTISPSPSSSPYSAERSGGDIVHMAQVSHTTTRVVPGAQQQQKNKKSKQHAHANGNGNDAMAKEAHASTLTSLAPALNKLDDSVKVKAQDVKEQSASHSDAKQDDKSPLQAVLTKRIKVLSKKLHRAIAYESLDDKQLNDDQRRIVASKKSLEASVAELSEVSKALEVSESLRMARFIVLILAFVVQIVESQEAKASRNLEIVRRQEDNLETVFQLMHLHSVLQPSLTASFAPVPLPPVVEHATGQEVAAVHKLYSDLSSSNDVMSFNEKQTIIRKVEQGSSDRILGDTPFHQVKELLQGLNTPATLNNDIIAANVGEISESKEVPVSSITFGQASELKESAPPSESPQVTVEQQDSPHDSSRMAQSQNVGRQPVEQTTNGASSHHVNAWANLGSTASPKVIDWSANDDDDLGDLEIQPVNQRSIPTEEVRVTHEPANGAANSKSRANGAYRGAGKYSNKGFQKKSTTGKTVPAGKVVPEVDEDGFTVASSKRTRHLQQQQGARNGRSSTRGGRSAA